MSTSYIVINEKDKYQRASLWSISLRKPLWNSYMGSMLENRRVMRPSGIAFSLITALRNHYTHTHTPMIRQFKARNHQEHIKRKTHTSPLIDTTYSIHCTDSTALFSRQAPHTKLVTLMSHERSSAHHCDDLQILQVSPFCCQNLFSNEVGFVRGISLKKKAYFD